MARSKKDSPKIGTYDYVLHLADSETQDEDEIASAVQAAHDLGDRRATYALAMGYLRGCGGYPQSIRKAVPLLKIAAQADVASAHFDIAICYEKGEGVRRSEKMAYRHYLAAALNGDNDSLVEVGRCLFHGIGTQRDRKSADIWFRRAEALGISASQVKR